MPMTCLPDQILRDPSAIHVPFVSAWKLSRPAECFRRLTFLSSALFAFFGEISFFLVFFRAGVLESAIGGEFGSVNDKNSVVHFFSSIRARPACGNKQNKHKYFFLVAQQKLAPRRARTKNSMDDESTLLPMPWWW